MTVEGQIREHYLMLKSQYAELCIWDKVFANPLLSVPFVLK